MSAHYLIVLLIAALAGARTWRLLAVDDVALPFRNLYYKLVPNRWYEWADGLLTCPFCMGWWVTLVWSVTGLLWADNGVWWWLAAGPFAANFLGAQLNAWLDVRPIEDKSEIGEHDNDND